ncbi:RDD family protein [compost metagenome]
MKYSGFWKRLAAACIDGFVVHTGVVIINQLLVKRLAFALFSSVHRDGIIAGSNSYRFMSEFTLELIVNFIFIGMYFVLMESSKLQATLGKMALGLIVVNGDNERISPGRAIGRYFGKYLTVTTLFIGFILCGFTRKKQALHDILSGTYVVRKGAQKPSSLPSLQNDAGHPLEEAPILYADPSMLYAGFWKRFFAYGIDGSIIYMLTSIAIILYQDIIIFIIRISRLFFVNDPYKLKGLLDLMSPSNMGLITSAITLIICWVYYSWMESSKVKATLGKMALGIVVIDENYERISFGRASARFFSKFISSITFCIGFIMVAFNSHKQGMHDQISKTYVINKNRLSSMVHYQHKRQSE